MAKAQLKQRWGTMRKVLSSEDRLRKIVADILLDMETRDRLKSGRGNAMLVSGSIYSACRLFEMFQQHDLAGKCAIVTSYKPAPADIKGEETGEGLTEKLRQYGIYRKMLAAHFNEPEDAAMGRVEEFEKEVKKRFVEEPGRMKLLLVVDKLLTGFDAPPATCLYIDKPMQDHGLFRAICRVNRLDGDDKEYGYIIDYKDLFRSLEQSIKDYTGEAFDAYDAADIKDLLKDRLQQGRERLEDAREQIKALCEPVEPPHDTAAYLIDLKMYEPAMRHLLNTYIRAEESETLSAFDDMTLVQLVVERGEAAIDSLPGGIRGNRDAVAETIENNVRRIIIDEMAVNPKYYEKMSERFATSRRRAGAATDSRNVKSAAPSSMCFRTMP